MTRAWVVFRREYLASVKSASFVATTLVTPALFAALGSLPSIVGGGERAVVGPAGTAEARVAFAFGTLLFMAILVNGREVLRRIVQEKADRIVEILLSSVTPLELLAGRVLGVAAAGLTQVVTWMAMAACAALVDPAHGRDGPLAAALARPALPVFFVVFFLLGYLVNVAAYAIGGAASSSERAAQQWMGPVSMALAAPLFALVEIAGHPSAPLAVALSFVPFYAPVVMFVRVLVSTPPPWQIAVVTCGTAATVPALLWIAAKIFRVGVLASSTTPTLRELWRWVRLA